MAEAPRTDRNRTNAAPANPVSGANGTDLSGGLGGLLQMLMQFFQQFLGGAGGGIGSFFSGLMGTVSDQISTGLSGRTSTAPGRNSSPDGPSSSARGVVDVPSDGKFSSARALSLCRADNAREGYCAKGVANILEAQGYNITRADGHHWDRTLPQSGWVKLEGVNARNAPEGAVLVYDSDVQRGRAPRNGRNGQGGDEFGHAEIVCYDANGNRKYVSDAARDNAGGTVPNNFAGAYVPRERYELMLAEQRRERQAETAVARNQTPAPSTNSGRNTSVAAAIDGPAIQAASLRTSFADADQRRLVAATPAGPVIQPNAAPAPAP